MLDLIGIAAVERGSVFRKDEVHKREQCLPLGNRIVITRAGCHRTRLPLMSPSCHMCSLAYHLQPRHGVPEDRCCYATGLQSHDSK